MKRRWKIASSLVAAAFLAVAVGNKAWADANPANDTAGVTLTVTPNVDYGLSIDTTNVSLALGNVALGASTFTVTPATLTVLGTWSSQEFNVVGAITGNAAWVFDSSSSNLTTDHLVGYIVAKATTSPSIALGDFIANSTAPVVIGNNSATTPSIRAGGSTGNGTRFEFDTATGAVSSDLDAMAVGYKRHLWFRLDLPTTTTDGSAATVKYTFTAVPAS